MKRAAGAFATLLLAIVGLGGSAGAQPVNNERILIIFTVADAPGRVIAVGPVSGTGVTKLLSHDEGPNGSFTDVYSLKLGSGSIVFTQTGTEDFPFDAASCSATASGQGTFTLGGGTGAFSGVTGSGRFSQRGKIIGSRSSSGACLGPDSGAAPAALVVIEDAAGTATRPR
ncbi:MAG: hypothetical protein M3256_25845 [Actinomycetota bacterium]|nr:hypothetical protein [Actinomycetota bacterium]